MHSLTLVLLFLLCLVVTCHAYSTFTTNCSIPSNSVNFVSSPDTRGTLDIVYSCLFTLWACTWSIQHLNVPEQRVVKRAAVGALKTDRAREEGAQTSDLTSPLVKPDQTSDESRRDRVRYLPAKTDGIWSDFRWTLNGLWRDVKWMLFTIVAPEFVFGKALGDLVSARILREQMKSLAEFDGVEWGLEHGFYVNMGGFVGFEQNDEHQVPDQVQGNPLAATQIYMLRTTKAGTDESLDESAIIERRADDKTWIERLPDITVAEIQEKSQSNLFVKIVAVFQVSWVILQVVVRARKGLSISLLELTVVAFSTCAIIIYIVLLHKPQGIQIPTRIKLEHGALSAISSILTRRAVGVTSNWYPSLIIWNPFFNWSVAPPGVLSRIPNDFICLRFPATNLATDGEDLSSVLTMTGGVLLGSAIFGSIHIAGWNSTFPTSTEQTLWRISSILVTTLLPVSFVVLVLLIVVAYIMTAFSPDGPESPDRLLSAWKMFVCMLYFLARVFMLIEVIRTLFYLPPDSYVSTWASNVPHVS